MVADLLSCGQISSTPQTILINIELLMLPFVIALFSVIMGGMSKVMLQYDQPLLPNACKCKKVHK